jgi:hypothetical protein
MMSPTTPLNFNAFGIFIVPGETEEAFLLRAHALLANKNEEPSFKESRAIVKKAFGVDPIWVKVFYSDIELYPWEIACTWYDEVPSIQLHTRFKDKKTFLGIYSEEAVLAHEYVHAVRAPLGDSVFEEFFSYHISNPFRRIVGPIFEEPRESLFLVLLLLSTTIAAICSDLFMERLFWLLFLLLGFCTIAFIFYLSLRLVKRFSQFRRCLRNLAAITPTPLALMIRLTDVEIILFSKQKPEEIMLTIQEKRMHDYRWRSLCDSYCKNCLTTAQY